MRDARFVAVAAYAAACAGAKPEIEAQRAPLASELSPDGEVTLTNASDYAKRRDSLIRFIWGAAARFPRDRQPDQIRRNVPSPIGPLRNLKRIDDLVVDMDAGEHTLMHHFIPTAANNRLVIVHQGHGPPCGFGDSNGGATDWGLVNAIDSLLSSGYSVLGRYMPHFLPNECDIATAHPKMFASIQVAEGSVIKFFVEPTVIALNYLKSKSRSDDFPTYVSYDMIGLSGGGWSTTLYAALDPTIEVSVPVAGTSPLYMRKYLCAAGQGPEAGCYNGYYGDTEQGLPALYQVAGYLDLYAMGAHGTNRRQVQVLNRRDNCCFGERQFKGPGSGAGAWDKAVRAYENVVAAAVDGTGAGSFKLIIDDNATKHEISRWAMANVILPALARAEPPRDASAANDRLPERDAGPASEPRPDDAPRMRTDPPPADAAAARHGGNEPPESHPDAARGRPGVSVGSCAFGGSPRGRRCGLNLFGLALAFFAARARLAISTRRARR